MSSCSVSFVVNGEHRTVEAPPLKRLLDVLREDLKLTGTKEGCGEGECGACSVLVNGELVNSCLFPVMMVSDATICTIEGVAADDRASRIQRGFAQCGGAQCGICTPGMIMASVHLLSRNATPSRQEIVEALAGNLCRCTGYQKIIDAVVHAVAEQS